MRRAKAYIAQMTQDKALKTLRARTTRLSLASLLVSASCSSTQYVGRVLTPENAETIRATGTPYVTVLGPDGKQQGTLLEVGATRSLIQLQHSTIKTGMPPKLQVQSTQYSTMSVDNSSIREVTTANHARGAGEGLGLGFVGGALGGAALGALGGSSGCGRGEAVCFDSLGRGGGAMLGALIGLSGGVFYGAIIGAMIGHRTTYTFE